MKKASLVIDAKAGLGEGAIWDNEKKLLYWIDIVKKNIHIFDSKTGVERIVETGQLIGTIVPRKSGGLVVAMERGIYLLDEKSGELSFLTDPESNIPGNRFNDGKCDPAGRLWVGTMSMHGVKKAGSLYCLEVDHRLSIKIKGVSISNGIAWSPDMLNMYYIDTPTKEVWCFDYNAETGDISNRKVAVTIPEGEGFPDGMTIDADGMIWVAHWDGWRVSRWNPRTGEKLDEISVPAALVTSCAFGGEELNELYITTASKDLNEEQLAEQLHAGGLFCVKTEVKGIPSCKFGG